MRVKSLTDIGNFKGAANHKELLRFMGQLLKGRRQPLLHHMHRVESARQPAGFLDGLLNQGADSAQLSGALGGFRFRAFCATPCSTGQHRRGVSRDHRAGRADGVALLFTDRDNFSLQPGHLLFRAHSLHMEPHAFHQQGQTAGHRPPDRVHRRRQRPPPEQLDHRPAAARHSDNRPSADRGNV